MANKMTYVSAISDVLNGIALTDEHKEKLTALKASLEKRASGERKPTATQKANVAVKETIAEFLGTVEFATATEIGKACGEISNQKASALLTAMVTDEVIEREVIKRKAYFKVVA